MQWWLVQEEDKESKQEEDEEEDEEGSLLLTVLTRTQLSSFAAATRFVISDSLLMRSGRSSFQLSGAKVRNSSI